MQVHALDREAIEYIKDVKHGAPTGESSTSIPKSQVLRPIRISEPRAILVRFRIRTKKEESRLLHGVCLKHFITQFL